MQIFGSMKARATRLLKSLVAYTIVAVLAVVAWIQVGPSANEAEVVLAGKGLVFGTSGHPDAGHCLGTPMLSTVGVLGLPTRVSVFGEENGMWVRFSTTCMSSLGWPVQIYWSGRAKPLKVLALGGGGGTSLESQLASRD
ncbi:hypothetical protein COV42_02440 [Candidatus Campbellbacteria bacterium CG11_big_fil_rev_8_21_14_0_20_44_21]|uniref:Uncharacterized protein n=1 Tax=Candidatus Campbellbacteria bacterium CG22_combo_CG10-13_8_21_14_all_43_18 TaxID=1974530 RepID=A0A2H0DXB1_9BACT|nr:MAG: hypothetical protein COW82_01680 [Candidatus Campbellbacteria bacterium CG22_combo_CG10-13_8_21_14_all_43_18]PIR24125.1 MAG: hypothetical protein COV42_02440 [Candidatus Campbellbacteria bacterium CG11_big_fil_rev_8_21_14_0_20_44_21]